MEKFHEANDSRNERDREFTNNVTLSPFRAAIVALEKQ
jgi:hypothetical protein